MPLINASATLKWFGRQVQDALLGDLDQRLEQAGAAWLAMSRSLAPVKTGRLRAEEGYRVRDGTLTLIMGAPYDIFQEFGTRNIPPHPHVRPAMAAIGRVFGGTIALQFNTLARGPWTGIHAVGGGFVVPRGLTAKQLHHVRSRLLPVSQRLHRGNVRRARMTVRRFD
jgi:hypothetical protein